MKNKIDIHAKIQHAGFKNDSDFAKKIGIHKMTIIKWKGEPPKIYMLY